MLPGSLEDPATGSASSTLAAYLALHKAEITSRATNSPHKFEMVQGVEMDRWSVIGVEVISKEDRIEKIIRSQRHGRLAGPMKHKRINASHYDHSGHIKSNCLNNAKSFPSPILLCSCEPFEDYLHMQPIDCGGRAPGCCYSDSSSPQKAKLSTAKVSTAVEGLTLIGIS